MTEPQSREAFHASARLYRAARDLLQNAGELDRPSDSYLILGNVLDAARCLEVALVQLAEWHRGTEADRHFHKGEDSTVGIMTTVEELDLAVQQADGLRKAISRAYGANAVVHWFDEVAPPDET
jgi:hypothetical protein